MLRRDCTFEPKQALIKRKHLLLFNPSLGKGGQGAEIRVIIPAHISCENPASQSINNTFHASTAASCSPYQIVQLFVRGCWKSLTEDNRLTHSRIDTILTGGNCMIGVVESQADCGKSAPHTSDARYVSTLGVQSDITSRTQTCFLFSLL